MRGCRSAGRDGGARVRAHIVSDAWAAYAHLEQWNKNIYTHAVVVQQHNFVDPDDQDTHMQTIENM